MGKSPHGGDLPDGGVQTQAPTALHARQNATLTKERISASLMEALPPWAYVAYMRKGEGDIRRRRGIPPHGTADLQIGVGGKGPEDVDRRRGVPPHGNANTVAARDGEADIVVGVGGEDPEDGAPVDHDVVRVRRFGGEVAEHVDRGRGVPSHGGADLLVGGGGESPEDVDRRRGVPPNALRTSATGPTCSQYPRWFPPDALRTPSLSRTSASWASVSRAGTGADEL